MVCSLTRKCRGKNTHNIIYYRQQTVFSCTRSHLITISFYYVSFFNYCKTYQENIIFRQRFMVDFIRLFAQYLVVFNDLKLLSTRVRGVCVKTFCCQRYIVESIYMYRSESNMIVFHMKSERYVLFFL